MQCARDGFKPPLRPAQPHLRVHECFLSGNAAMPLGQQVKVDKSASFVEILEVCKFTFCDRKWYTASYGSRSIKTILCCC